MTHVSRRGYGLWYMFGALSWLSWDSFVHSSLENLRFTTEFNLLAEVGQMLANKSEALYDCRMEPRRFSVARHFYSLRCHRAVRTVRLKPQGQFIYSDGQLVSSARPLIAQLLRPDEPVIFTLQSCSRPVSGSSLNSCAAYHIDLYRYGDSDAELQALGVSSSQALSVTPSFDPKHLHYTTHVERGTSFVISATSKHLRGTVGLDALDSVDGFGGGCGTASKRSEVWHIEGLKAIGEYRFKVCAEPPDAAVYAPKEYLLTVKVTPQYSAKLIAIDVGDYHLVPAFSPTIKTYDVQVPQGVLDVPVRVVAEDEQAALEFVYAGEETNEGIRDDYDRGNASTLVKLRDNSKLKFGERPQWNRLVSAKVVSADSRERATYTIMVSVDVSKYSYLQNITVGDTDCVLTPAFKPEITHYDCLWWWENSTSGEEKPIGSLFPHIDKEKCKDCRMFAPEASADKNLHLAYAPEEAERIPWSSGKNWSRRFLYGEEHTVPFQVVSADQYTSTTYYIHMKRDCPGWMATWFTRKVSEIATAIALIMAVSSIANVRSLAQQVQFMTLTTEIKGTPEIYRDFADNLKDMNLDVFSYIPWTKLGFPTKEKILQLKEEWKKLLEHKLGIDHAELLMQYCGAFAYFGNGDLLYPNAVLHQDPEAAQGLIEALAIKKDEPDRNRRLENRAFLSKVHEHPEDAPHGTVFGQLHGNLNNSLRQWLHADTQQGFPVGTFSDDIGSRRLKEANKIRRFVLEHKDYVELVKRANMTDNELRRRYVRISCTNLEVQAVVTLLVPIAHLREMKDVLESTTGTFLILFGLIVGFGAIYGIFYHLVLKGRQKRMKILEPGPLWIFILDYVLIAFAKSTSKVAFSATPTTIVFGHYRAPQEVTRNICITSLVMYPVVFVSCMFGIINKLIRTHKLVWNDSLEQWSDPVVHSVKVSYVPEYLFPLNYVPILSGFLRVHIRACLPVVDPEGEPLDFAEPENIGDKKQEEHGYRWDDELLQEHWLQEIDEEMQKLESCRETEHEHQRLRRLKEEKDVLMQERNGKQEHIDQIRQARDEQRRLENEGLKDETPPWFDPELIKEDQEIRSITDFKCHSLDGIVNTFKSRKHRSELERLTMEERFAMLQFIDETIREEQRIMGYNVLKVAVIDGYLKPWEPIKELVMGSSKPGRDKKPWLPEVDDYRHPSSEWPAEGLKGVEDFIGGKNGYGHVDELMDYTVEIDEDTNEESKFIQNEIGQRLVYLGNDGRGPDGRRGDIWTLTCLSSLVPGGTHGGNCMWVDEEDDGWESWYKAAKQKKSTLRYADKWQWLKFNEDEPWKRDEESEQTIIICCTEVEGQNLFFFKEMQRIVRNQFRDRVPFRVCGEEKVEMRKWIWKTLLDSCRMKIKIGYMADQHPKFHMWGPSLGIDQGTIDRRKIVNYSGRRTISDIAHMSFGEVWKQIEQAKPREDKLLKREKYAMMNNELQEYVVMRVEDTYAYDDPDGEPWNNAVDPTAEEEVKVQFDTERFWWSKTNPQLEAHRQTDGFLVPENGYHSNSAFTREPEVPIAVKRYIFLKPDGSHSKVKVEVMMKHVLPLMRYTHGFRVNVEQDQLDMYYKETLSLVLGEKMYAEEYNYIIERVTTLISIILLASRPAGWLCAATFYISKSSSWFAQIYTANKALVHEEAKRTEVIESRKKLRTAKSKQSLDKLLEDEAEGIQSTSRTAQYSKAFVQKDVLKEMLQSTTLLLLLSQQISITPAPLCAIFCIALCSVTMIFMNLSTFEKQLRDWFTSFKNIAKMMIAIRRRCELQVLNFLDGNNMFDIQFVPMKHGAVKTSVAQRLAIIIPQLGIIFEGEPDVPDTMTPEEIRSQQIGKKIVPYIMDLHPGDQRLGNPQLHWRWEQDVVGSLYVAMDIDQMMYRKRLPEIVATLQCLNHVDSDICSPEFDSYLTLVKQLPDGSRWEEEYNHMAEKREALMKHWEAQIHDWLFNTLGAVENEKTDTIEIKEGLSELLSKEVHGSTQRRMFKMRINSLEVPLNGSWETKDLDGKFGYVRTLYSSEKIHEDFATDRVSSFGIFRKAKLIKSGPEREGYTLEFPESGEEFSIDIPFGVAVIKLAIWVQDPDKMCEEVVGFTQEFNIEDVSNEFTPDQYPADDKAPMVVYSKWKMHGRSMEPLGGFLLSDAESQKAMFLEQLQEKTGCLARLRAVGKRLYAKWLKPPEPDEAEIMSSRGSIEAVVRKFGPDEMHRDAKLMRFVAQCTGGESTLDAEKVLRHKDHWLAFAQVFGITPEQQDLDEMKDHLEKMRKVWGELKDRDIDEVRALKEDILVRKENMKKYLEESSSAKRRTTVSVKDLLASGGIRKVQHASKDKRIEKGNKYIQDLERRLKELLQSQQMKDRMKEKRGILLSKQMRRALADGVEMAESVTWLEKELAFANERLQMHREFFEQREPLREFNIEYRRIGTYKEIMNHDRKASCWTRCFRSAIKKDDEETNQSAFFIQLCDKLTDYREDNLAFSKQILHYVFVSDHLKPSKRWAPDTIVPHVATILSGRAPSQRLTHERFEIIEDGRVEVMMFRRETTLINGRLSFQSETKAYITDDGVVHFGKGLQERLKSRTSSQVGEDRSISMSQEQRMKSMSRDSGGVAARSGEEKTLYLYWDGKRRWTISPEKGHAPPYGLKSEVVRGYLWSQDNAVQPSAITKPWYAWSPEAGPGEKAGWRVESSAKVSSPDLGRRLSNLGSAGSYYEKANLTEVQDLEEEKQGACKAIWRELRSFVDTTEVEIADENRDCLVSLTTEAIHFAWKDESIERLADFRRFLLTEFGSYPRAWLYMTRAKTFSVELGTHNLARIFMESYEAITQELDQEDEAGSSDDEEFDFFQTQAVNAATGGMTSSASMVGGMTSSIMVGMTDSTEGGMTSSIVGGMTSSTVGGMTGSPSIMGDTRSYDTSRMSVIGAENGRPAKPRLLHRIGSVGTNDPSEHAQNHQTREHTRTTFRAMPASRQEVETARLKDLLNYLGGSHCLVDEGDGVMREKTSAEKMQEFEQMAKTIMEKMDVDNSGHIDFMEMRDLYEDERAGKATELNDLAAWLRQHPWYTDKIHHFWGELSDGLELTLDEFTDSMRSVLLKFSHKAMGASALGTCVCLNDRESVCQVLSATWLPQEDVSKIKSACQNLAIKFRVQGPLALELYKSSCKTNSEGKPQEPVLSIWSIQLHGSAKTYTPTTCPSMSFAANTAKVSVSQTCTLTYSDLERDKTIYFKYGGASSSQFTKISFKARNLSAPDEKAEAIFSNLDLNMSGSITRPELVPISGDQIEHVDQSMVKYSIPRSHIDSLIRVQSLPGQEDYQVIKLKVNPNFATKGPWTSLRKALNPDWECEQPEQEEVKFMMLPNFYKVWRSVIKECRMDTPQNWVRFYDGGYLEHPYISGVYMRSGEGIQRWANGQIYVGHWKDHLYHGTGTLWAKIADYDAHSQLNDDTLVAGPTPIYRGNWQAGHRHGHGTLYWEQDRNDYVPDSNSGHETVMGIPRTYTGQFQHGLFHGKGVLTLKDATPQLLPRTNRQASRWQAPPPQMQPWQMLKFEGEFESNWNQTLRKVKEGKLAPNFLKAHEEDFEMRDGGGEEAERVPFLSLQHLYEIEGDLEEKAKLTQKKIRKYLGLTNKDENQRSGTQVPDIGLAFYSLRLDGVPADCFHIVSGKATYADGSQYNGRFEEGYQHGRGILTQFSPENANEKLAEYSGNWDMGKRTGKGTYNFFGNSTQEEPAYTYRGHFEDGRRHGEGTLEVFDVSLEEEFGYKEYCGEWKLDMRNGSGEMRCTRSGQSFIFTGMFREGKRHGFGAMKGEVASDEWRVIYQGEWANDYINTLESNAWSHLDDHVYYGQFTKDGKRHGAGVLYKKEAMNVDEFKAAFDAKAPGQKPPQEGDIEKYIAYDGEWKHDIFDGFGKQFFETGKYEGQFRLGQRDGRGTWVGHGDNHHKTWTYRPQGSSETGPRNWERDQMHGIAIVEDDNHVHENVIYNQGKPQMPFTEQGPPKTLAVGRRWNATDLFFGGKKRHEPDTLQVKAECALTEVVHQPNKTLDKILATNDDALGVLVRQPTLLETPEEDIWISGGTDGNDVLNGIYFKLQGTFGRPLYKLVKKIRRSEEVAKTCSCVNRLGFNIKEVTARYMFRHPGGEHWVIAGRHQWGGSTTMTHWAHVKTKAAHPKDIEEDAEWYVWHEQTQVMRKVGDKLSIESHCCGQTEPNPVDSMKLKVVAGYEVHGLGHVDSASHSSVIFLMRHPSQFFGRPVYESSRADQFLFWIGESEGGFWIDADEDLELYALSNVQDVLKKEEEFYRKKGYWVLANQLPPYHVKYDWKDAIAWVKDKAMTPFEIRHQWYMRDPTKRILSPIDAGILNPDLKIKPEEKLARAMLPVMASVDPEPIQSNTANARELQRKIMERTSAESLSLQQQKQPNSMMKLARIPGLDDEYPGKKGYQLMLEDDSQPYEHPEVLE